MFKIVPTVAHAGSTKIFITDQTRLLQYKRVYNSTKILTLEIIFSAQTSNTNVLFQHKYVYCTINQIFFYSRYIFFPVQKFSLFPSPKKNIFLSSLLILLCPLSVIPVKTYWLVCVQQTCSEETVASSVTLLSLPVTMASRFTLGISPEPQLQHFLHVKNFRTASMSHSKNGLTITVGLPFLPIKTFSLKSKERLPGSGGGGGRNIIQNRLHYFRCTLMTFSPVLTPISIFDAT